MHARPNRTAHIALVLCVSVVAAAAQDANTRPRVEVTVPETAGAISAPLLTLSDDSVGILVGRTGSVSPTSVSLQASVPPRYIHRKPTARRAILTGFLVGAALGDSSWVPGRTDPKASGTAFTPWGFPARWPGGWCLGEVSGRCQSRLARDGDEADAPCLHQ